MGDEGTQLVQEGIATFPCQGCGSQMLFDVVRQSLKCKYCGNEKVIENDTDQPSEYELIFSNEEAVSKDLKDWGREQQTVKCESCGSETLIPASQTATICAFCGSAKVLAQGDAGSIRPESMLPFQISQQDAVAAFQRWKKSAGLCRTSLKRKILNR